MWDQEYEGFYWTVDRKGNVEIYKKILYGLSFSIYALCEYTLATGDQRGIEYAGKVFDIIWGWDRFADSGAKSHAKDNTSYGHNVEFAWLLLHALEIMELDRKTYEEIIKKQLNHTLSNGIDWKFGGVYVEGGHGGGVYDREKEFWQQAEVLIGMLDGCLYFKEEKYWPAYENVHRFVFDRMINHKVGERWPLLTREGKSIWTHMSNSWKVNYHTIRCIIQCIKRLDKLSKMGT